MTCSCNQGPRLAAFIIHVLYSEVEESERFLNEGFKWKYMLGSTGDPISVEVPVFMFVHIVTICVKKVNNCKTEANESNNSRSTTVV